MDDRAVRVLLIEDDEDDYLLTRELLDEIERGRFLLHWEPDPEAALRLISGDRHDVYLIDYRLGGHDGLHLLREAIARGCSAPMILLTGQGDREVDLQAMLSGAADYLVKGQTDSAALERAIRYAIERKRTEEDLRHARAELERRVQERTEELARANEELRHRVDELKQAKEAAEAANRAKDTLLAVVSHELRTPLTPVLFATSALLCDDQLAPEVRELLQIVERNLGVEVRLIDDLLDVSRITVGKMAYRFEVVDMHDLIDRELQAIGPRPDEGRSPELSIEFAATRTLVKGDAARLQQVLDNLIRNALKFTPAVGRIAITTRNQGDRLLVSIRDSGIGIAPETLPRIFGTFEQGEASAIRRFGGLGLGLAISKAIAHAHGARLEARSEGEGRGAEFILDLAVAEPLSAEPARPVASDRATRGDGAIDGDGGGLRVVFVEDDPTTHRVFVALLRKSGFEVLPAASYREAIAQLNEPFDLLLCDLALPDGTGWDLMRHIRSRQADVPGIAMSGFGSEEDRARSRTAGFDAHLTKPIQYPELMETIDRLVRQSDRSDSWSP